MNPDLLAFKSTSPDDSPPTASFFCLRREEGTGRPESWPSTEWALGAECSKWPIPTGDKVNFPTGKVTSSGTCCLRESPGQWRGHRVTRKELRWLFKTAPCYAWPLWEGLFLSVTCDFAFLSRVCVLWLELFSRMHSHPSSNSCHCHADTHVQMPHSTCSSSLHCQPLSCHLSLVSMHLNA